MISQTRNHSLISAMRLPSRRSAFGLSALFPQVGFACKRWAPSCELPSGPHWTASWAPRSLGPLAKQPVASWMRVCSDTTLPKPFGVNVISTCRVYGLPRPEPRQGCAFSRMRLHPCLPGCTTAARPSGPQLAASSLGRLQVFTSLVTPAKPCDS